MAERPIPNGDGPQWLSASGVSHRYLTVNGIRMHIAERGRGPLVVLLHGFPESAYSWRHQFGPLADAGCRVVAPDQRGYAWTEQPDEVESYTLLHLVADVVALIGELGHDEAVLVGHDWGAIVGWVTAALRPDLVRAVAGLSVPPILPMGMPSVAASRERYGPGFYQNYFQEPGRADAELAEDPASALRRILVGGSGDAPGAERPRPWVVPPGSTLLGLMPEPESLPTWLSAADVATFAHDLAAHGARAFTGALNWYRNIERNQELLAPFTGLRVTVPSLYAVGDRDMVTALRGSSSLPGVLPSVAPRLRAAVSLPGCGHWTQQERPAEVSTALLDLLAAVANT